MCNDPKIYGPDEERVTEVIAKIDILYPNGTFEVIYSGVKMCLPRPDFLFFVCLSHFCLDQFAVSHDLHDVTEKQKQEHTAGSCQTKLDKKRNVTTV